MLLRGRCRPNGGAYGPRHGCSVHCQLLLRDGPIGKAAENPYRYRGFPGCRRGAAIRQAVHDQLGLTVLEITPVGLESSAGSTPLRLAVEGNPEEYLFGKLYTLGHVRADRWYKLWRTILYGAMEDEHPFHSVRQLTQYEDYVLRLLRDAGVRTAAPYGIVEITPEREYLLVTEFFSGAVELGDADIGDAVIDQGLLLIRKLWDAGLAHRDIKPGNLMVRDGELLLGFAVAFGILLDTIVVRAVLVSALNLDVGRWMWWPGKLAKKPDPAPAELGQERIAVMAAR